MEVSSRTSTASGSPRRSGCGCSTPTTLEVKRGWALAEPVRGSFAVFGKDGELGLGRFRAENPARLWWFDVDAMLASSAYELDEGDAVDAVRIPPDTQGAIWAELGGVGPGLWLARSNTTCGVLVGPDGRSRAFVPGAEGMALTGPDQLWVVSESGSRLYQEKGRPMTPHLARFDTSDMTEVAWSRHAVHDVPRPPRRRSRRTRAVRRRDVVRVVRVGRRPVPALAGGRLRCSPSASAPSPPGLGGQGSGAPGGAATIGFAIPWARVRRLDGRLRPLGRRAWCSCSRVPSSVSWCC